MYFPSHPAIPSNALTWRFTQSRGPGGQHVNKASTAVELRVAVDALHIKHEVRERLLMLASESNTQQREIIIRTSNSRSQWQNRIAAWSRLLELLERASRTRKVRVKTKPTPSSKRKRLELKKRHSEAKARRRKPEFD